MVTDAGMIDNMTVVRHIGKEIVFDLFNYELNSESEPSGSRTELHLNADRERVASWIARQTETLRTPKVKVRAMMHTHALAVLRDVEEHPDTSIGAAYINRSGVMRRLLSTEGAPRAQLFSIVGV